MKTASLLRHGEVGMDLGQIRLRVGSQEIRCAISALDGDEIELRPLDNAILPPAGSGATVELIFPATAADPAFAIAASVLDGQVDWLRLSLCDSSEERIRAVHHRVHGQPGDVPDDARDRVLQLIERRLRGPVATRLLMLIERAENELNPGTPTELHWRGSPLRQVREQLQRKAAVLVDAFLQTSLSFAAASPRRSASATLDGASLRLVDDDEMTVWLTRSEALRSIERQARSAWFRLRPALGLLLGSAAESDLESLGAEALMDAWWKALKSQSLESEVQQLLIMLFARQDLFDLSAFYIELRQDLQRNGLLFEVAQRAQVIRRPERPQAAGAARTPLPDAGAKPGETVVAAAGGNWSMPPITGGTAQGWGPVAAPEAMSVARQLWNLGSAANDLPIQVTDGQRATIDDQTLLAAIRHVLAQSQDASADANGFIKAVAKQATGTGQAQLIADQKQAEALSLLAKLQASLAADQIVPEAFGQWSRPLIAPLFGAQLQSEGLIESGDAVRKLFELIEFGSVLVQERKDQSGQQIKSGIDQVVQRLAAQPTLTPDAVTEGSRELDRLLQRHRKAALAIEDRVVEACIGQQRLIDARRVVDASLNSAFSGMDVPTAWISLLERRLVPLLVLNVLREGPDSDAWKTAEQQMDLLAQDWLALREGRPPARGRDEALRWIRSYLADSDSVGVHAADPLVTLGDAYDAVAVDWAPYRSVLADVLNEPRVAPVDDRLDALQQQIDVIQPGDWLTFKSAQGRPRALKLAWHAPGRERFVFVSQLGHKADDMEREQLLESMRLGDVRVLEDGQSSVIERAWRRMMESMHDQLAVQATHDALTGLLNRKELERRLALWLRGKQREPLLAMWIGVDHMRLLNEARGLEAGDHVLSELGKMLNRFAAEQGADALAARIAGDEFLLTLPAGDDSNTEAQARRVMQSVNDGEWRFDGHALQVTVSIGVCIADHNCSSIETLLRDAEHACRAAKESGGNRVYTHHVDDYRLTQMRETFQWVGKVEQSLDQRTLRLFGQRAKALSPRAEQAGDYLEVLLRMRDGERYASPESFIVAAERYGQIAAIDRFVLNELVRCLRLAPRQERLQIAFNVSARNITDAEFVDEIVRVLSDQPWPLRQLGVELTETAAIQQLADASLAMRRLNASGLSMVLDDFGSGWSSYHYLRRLPFDVVKVDGAFIRDIANSEEDLALARSINEVAHVLGKMTVAEHVENEETLRLVKDIGFDYAQGYLLGKPAPLPQMLSFEDP